MMRKKKLLAAVLSLCVGMASLPVSAVELALPEGLVQVHAGEEQPTSGTCGEDLTWEYDASTGLLTISGTGEMYDYYESPWDGLELTSVVIKDGVTSIGDYAFYLNESLTSVTIPESVTEMGWHAFTGTPWLTEQLTASPYVIVNHIVIAADPETCTGDLIIPDGVTSIGGDVFSECTFLTSVTIPESVTSIGESAFLGCSSLTSVTISGSVTSIGNNVFRGCSSLTSVTIPESVTEIGGGVFSGTPWLKEQFALSPYPYVVVNHIVIASDQETCTGDLIIPDGVTSTCN